jgi:hypothetical protein
LNGYRGIDRWVRIALLAVILLAAVLRLWQLPLLPPGLWFDEAINGVDARMVLSGAGLPLYFTANNGREPLFIYLQALSVAIFGPNPYSLRLVSAFVGILTIPALYFCGTTLLRSSGIGSPEDGDEAELAGSGAALVAAAVLAISYWHLSLSRLGLRVVMLPLVSSLAIAWFWRGWKRNAYRDFALSGAWFGISLYTYTAARFLLVVPVLFVLCEAIAEIRHIRSEDAAGRRARREIWRQRLTGLGLLAGICAILVLPLAIVAWRDPHTVLGRAAFVTASDAVQGQPEAPPQLLENLLLVARSFYDQGDHNLRHNLPGRPVNDPLLALLFTAGWLTALLKLKQARYRLLLIWLAVMLMPTILTTLAPHSLRGAGALPPLALLCAVGACSMLRLLSRAWNSLGRDQEAVQRHMVPVFVVALILISGSWTARDYFQRWAGSSDLGQAFELPQQLAAEAAACYLAEAAPAPPDAGHGSSFCRFADKRLAEVPRDRLLLISDQLYIQPQMVFALGILPEVALPAPWASDGHPAGSSYVIEDNLDPRQPMYALWKGASGPVFAALEPLSAEDARELAETAGTSGPEVIRAPLQRDSWPQLLAGALPESVHLQPRQIQTPLNVRFANGIRLMGYEVQPDWLAPDAVEQGFRLTLFWRLDEDADRSAAQTSSAFVHLANQDGVWATKNGAVKGRYFFSWPRLQQTIQDIRILQPPLSMPSGKGFFEVGLFRTNLTRPDLTERIPILDDQGRVAGDRVELGAIMIGQPPSQTDLSDLRPSSARFDDRIELIGWRVDRDPVQPGVLRVNLGWRALTRSTTDYTAFVHLVPTGSNGQIIAQHDEAPGGAANPTTRWVPGETVTSTFQLTMPDAAYTGDLELRVGLYEPASAMRLPVTSSDTDLPSATGGTYLVLPLVTLRPWPACATGAGTDACRRQARQAASGPRVF